jgi:hypothetical protein
MTPKPNGGILNQFLIDGGKQGDLQFVVFEVPPNDNSFVRPVSKSSAYVKA